MMRRYKNQNNHILTERRCHSRELQDVFSVEFAVITVTIWWLQQLGKDLH